MVPRVRRELLGLPPGRVLRPRDLPVQLRHRAAPETGHGRHREAGAGPEDPEPHGRGHLVHAQEVRRSPARALRHLQPHLWRQKLEAFYRIV